MKKMLKMTVAVLVTITAPIWIIPLMIIGGLWDSSKRMYTLLWGES